MSSDANSRANDDMKPEYDFSRAVRSEHALRLSKLSSDEAIVSEYWHCEGFDVKPFSKLEKCGGKTPDFLLCRNEIQVAYCEVKSFQRDNWLEEQLVKAPAGELARGLRQDPVFNRISNAIHTAWRQFESVNADHRLMNFLFLVNHDTSAGAMDLDRVLTAFEDPRGEILEPTSVQCAGGRIAEERRKIDLYVWFDFEANGTIRSRGYRVPGNPESRRWVCGLLGVTPDIVRNIPSAA